MSSRRTYAPKACEHCGLSFVPTVVWERWCGLKCRVWSRVSVGDPDQCWPWTGPRNEDGYGVISYGKAHRGMWTVTNGDIPPGLCVLHSCDNPPCCNPRHLHLGTNTENVAEREKRTRPLLRCKRWHNRIVLTEDMVVDARREYRDGSSCKRIADKFGISVGTMMAALSGKSWGWVTRERPVRKGCIIHDQHGDRNRMAKLTNDDVRSIRAKLASGCAVVAIAKEFHVSKITIWEIRRRRTWRNIE